MAGNIQQGALVASLDRPGFGNKSRPHRARLQRRDPRFARALPASIPRVSRSDLRGSAGSAPQTDFTIRQRRAGDFEERSPLAPFERTPRPKGRIGPVARSVGARPRCPPRPSSSSHGRSSWTCAYRSRLSDQVESLPDGATRSRDRAGCHRARAVSLEAPVKHRANVNPGSGDSGPRTPRIRRLDRVSSGSREQRSDALDARWRHGI